MLKTLFKNSKINPLLFSFAVLPFCTLSLQAAQSSVPSPTLPETAPEVLLPGAADLPVFLTESTLEGSTLEESAQSVELLSELQSDEAHAAQPSHRFHRALRERDLSVGYGRKIPLSRFHPRTKVTLYQVIPRWGRFRDSRQEFLWEVPITYAASPHSAYAAGLTLMYRYHFSSQRKFAPFVEIGSGFVFTNLDQKIRELSRSLNFSPQAGIGFRTAISPSSDLVFSARWFHLSNAGTRAPNVGVNNYLLTVGYSQLF